MISVPQEEYIFIVDTDTYAGNFERPLVAFMTGFVGECSVGMECIDFFLEEASSGEKQFIERAIIQKPDEHGTFRPASIWPTPGRSNPRAPGHPAYDSVAMFLREAPPQDYLNRWHERALRFCKNPSDFGCNEYVPSFEVQGSRLVKQIVTYEGVWLRTFITKKED